MKNSRATHSIDSLHCFGAMSLLDLCFYKALLTAFKYNFRRSRVGSVCVYGFF